MKFLNRRRLLGWGPLVLLCFPFTGLVHADPANPAVRLRIKNGHSIRVALGTRREQASGIRPEKGVWKVLLSPDLDGSAAEFRDITPGVASSRWEVPVTGDSLVLGSDNFLPTHVYQMEVRKERTLVGTAIVYLYAPPPPRSKVGRVEFHEGES